MKNTLLCLLLCGQTTLASGAEKRPNVVLVMADDIGLGDLSFYQRQLHPDRPPTVETPHLDRLIEEGMRFSDAHSPASLCAPTRFSMLTGNYSFRNKKGPWGVWNPGSDSGIDPHFTTIARLAKAGGYETAFFGKWGLGSATKKEDYTALAQGATAFGFDYALELPQGIQDEPFAFYENRKWLKAAEDSRFVRLSAEQLGYARHVGNKHEHDEGWGDSHWNPFQAGPLLIEKATAYLSSRAREPFFLYYCSQAVHIPHTAPEQLAGVALAGTTAGKHGDMIRELDLQVGLLIRALQETGVYENTLFVFTSDNGGLVIDQEMRQAGHDASNGWSGSKGSILEGGHRVPFLAVWPGVIPPGSESHEPIVTHDMVATMAALAGQALDRSQIKDSLNLLPLWQGKEARGSHTVLLHGSIAGGFSYAIRQGPWKLVMQGSRDYDPAQLQAVGLYNLAQNKRETHATNLIHREDQQERVEELLESYRRYRKNTIPTVQQVPPPPVP
ncbi:sulfatase family protein [Roseibacillus ishigakijimensis]|uniref:Arylsulfatase n=1 Tax=Roseibacillus ishigakijimensis TaxID=454146 RepID=A0A934VL41_9BACT|nr:arylsulfatase [Roseibacillus ishigakijimensis]MBK1832832.1 arylsulfatase [Roseibacillus ishigakijimensis]